MKGKDVEDALVELGLKRGVLFFRDIDEVFPADHFPIEEVEDILTRLNDLGIRVVENEGCLKARHRQKRRAA